METALIDRIYECSFAPELWPGVLDELAEMTDARGGVILAVNLAQQDILNWTTSGSVRDFVEKMVRSGMFARQQRANNFLRFRNGSFLTEAQVYASKEEMATDPLYREMLWPAGLGFCAGTAVTLPTGDMLILTIERDYVRGPPDAAAVDRLNTLRPHLTRSVLMSARLQLDRARIASETLTLLGLPALVFDEGGKVLAANGLMETLTDVVRWRAQGRVSLKDPQADALLRKAVETISVEGEPRTRSFALRGEDFRAALVAHVVPIRRSARDIFARSAGVVMFTPVTLPQAPPVELVQSLFDLTPAEARVARNITTGQTAEEIATNSGVSLNTVRTQLRGVLQKTGCRRQVEAVALLGGITVQRG